MSILPQIILNGIMAGALYGIVAIGFNLIYGTVKFFDLAYGSVLVISGYMLYTFLNILNLPISISLPISLIICGLFGYLCYIFVYRILENKKASSTIYLVASLGVFTVMQAIVSIFYTSQFKVISSESSKVFSFLNDNLIITHIQLITICLFFIIGILLAIYLKYFRIGKAIRAVADDKNVAEIIGINTKKIISLVFIIGSMIGGVAGIMAAYDTGIEPTMGFSVLLKGVIAAIIGGVGNIWGGMIGAIFLGLAENIGIWKLSGEWKDVISFSILIIFLLFRPQGIFGINKHK